MAVLCDCSGPQLLAQIPESRSYEHIDAAEQMIGGHALVEMKLVEEPRLVCRLPSHHRPPPSRPLPTESLFAGVLNRVLQHNRPLADVQYGARLARVPACAFQNSVGSSCRKRFIARYLHPVGPQ